MNFSPPSRGFCVFCRRNLDKVIYYHTSEAPPHGVCDVCSYALRHAWQEAQGERIVAISPHLVRTYALVPRLKKNRSPSDLSGYEFVTTIDGRLPFFDHVTPGKFLERLGDDLGVVTWNETTRRCYLGYDGCADFSEVVLAWSWGKSLRGSATHTSFKFLFRDFEHLLASPSADAGFYLGVKTAFEALLWCAEVEGEDNTLCVPLRESAVRYLAAKNMVIDNPRDKEEVDDSMVEIYRNAMSFEEVRVVGLITHVTDLEVSDPQVADSQESSTQESSTQESSTQESSTQESSTQESSTQESSTQVANSEEAEQEAGSPTSPSSVATRPPESIAPGYARPKASIKAP